MRGVTRVSLYLVAFRLMGAGEQQKYVFFLY